MVLSSMLIQGVSIYPLADLAPTYEHQLAREVSVSDLVDSANAITDRYRRDGYFLTRAAVSETDATTGSARIVVYEGYFSEVRIEGQGARAAEPFLRPLEGRRPVTLAELDRRLALASDIPGVTLASRIEPVIGDPSQHRLVVETTMRSAAAGLYVDNRGTPDQGPWQVYASANYNSVIQPGDQVFMSAMTVPDSPDELTYADASYSMALEGGGRVRIGVSGYRTDAPAGNRNGWVGGWSRAATIGISTPLVRSRDQNLWLNASFDVRKVGQNYVSTGQAEETLAVGRVSIAGQKRDEGGYVAGSIQLSQGFDALGATDLTSALNTRIDATGEFTKVNAQVSLYRDIGKYAGIYAEASGQWSNDPLLASEEFMVGGPNLGRAYDYAETSGDSAVAVSIEARLGYAPKDSVITFAQAYAFMDAAKVWNVRPGHDPSDRLASAGVGSRVTFDRDTTLRLELAKPLTRAPWQAGDNGWRAYVSLSRQF